MFNRSLSTVLALLVFTAWVQAASPEAMTNWPQWRGPLATGVATSPEADPPIKWSESENVKWKVKVPGSGSSTPIIWGDRVFIQTAIPTGEKASPPAAAAPPRPASEQAQRGPDGKGPGRFGKGGPGKRGPGGFGGGGPPTEAHQFVILCLDRATGKTIWQQAARQVVPHEGHHRDHGFASHSPMTDGKHVYAYFGSRGLHCYDMDGNLKWQKDLGRMQTKMSFGEGSSPALHGDTIVVNWDHEGEDFIVGLDAATGEERWRQPRDEDTSWSTPLVVEHEGRMQVVTAASSRIRSYDLATGKPLWQTGPLTANVIPTPVAGHGMVYAMSGFRGNALYAIRLGHEGDLTGSEAIAWRYDKNTPYVPSPMLYGDRLYFFSGNTNVLTSLDARTGKPVIDAQRVEGLQGVYASPVGAADRIYLTGRNGAIAVIKHADKLEVLATNQLDERIDASPAIVGKDLFLRGQEHLYCISGR